MNNNHKIYIVCPAYYATGGTELLHQLHSKFIERGLNSFIFYTGTNPSKQNYTDERFKYYVKANEISPIIEDNKNNYLIVPEIYFNSFNYKEINMLYWWLSVDHFLIPNNFKPEKLIKRDLKAKIKVLFNMSPYNMINKIINKKNVQYHLYQSHYAKQFLNKLHIRNKLPLSDYINPNVIYKEKIYHKEDIIIYNPQKGNDISQYLIANSPLSCQWVPIENMTPEEISKLMSKTKVYIDFGNHPGKDRIPREAVLNNCCIITNKKGSAKNNIDIPIPNKYKFENPIESSKQIYSLIEDIFNNFETHIAKFTNYKNKILSEEQIFEMQINILLNKTINKVR